MFALSASIGCGVFTMASLRAQFHHFCPDKEGILYAFFAVQECMFFSRPALLAMTVVSAVCSLWIFLLFVQQIIFVATETTTYEVLKKNNQGKSFFTAHALRNILVFLQTGQFSVCDSSLSINMKCCDKDGHCRLDHVDGKKTSLLRDKDLETDSLLGKSDDNKV